MRDYGFKRGIKGRIGDKLYEVKLKIFGNKYKINKKSAFKKQQWIFLTIMLAIPIAHWLVFFVYVNISSFLLAFQTPLGEWTLLNFSSFWDSLTVSGNELNIALLNTFIYFAVDVFVLMPGALFISFFIFKRIFGHKFFRVVFYLPSLISSVVIVTVFKEFIKSYGPLGVIMQSLGYEMPAMGLLGSPEYATKTIVTYCIWVGFGGSNLLLFSGAMSRIPTEVFEAAKLDGCGPGREVFQIIFPLIWPTIATLVIFNLTGFFSTSGPILLFTAGRHETTTLSFWIFQKIYGMDGAAAKQYNVVATAGLCFTIVSVPIILMIRRLLDKIPAVEY